jgi:PPIC-type PPIASE domain
VKQMPVACNLSTKLKASSADEVEELFAQLTRAHSTDTTNSGNLGWASPGDLVGPFESAMHELEISEVSAPVTTDFGVHVIRVTDRRAQDLEDMRHQISQQLIDIEVGQAWSDGCWTLTSRPTSSSIPATGSSTRPPARSSPLPRTDFPRAKRDRKSDGVWFTADIYFGFGCRFECEAVKRLILRLWLRGASYRAVERLTSPRHHRLRDILGRTRSARMGKRVHSPR